MEQQPPIRRVYMPEWSARTGYSATWTRVLEQRGRIPKPRRDPGCKRKYWLSHEVDAVVTGEYQGEAA